jgi:hypothetical protein
MLSKVFMSAVLLTGISACSTGAVQNDLQDATEDTGLSDISTDINRADVSIDPINPNLLGSFKVEERTSIYSEQTNVGASAFGYFFNAPMPPYLSLAASEGECALYLYDPNRCGTPDEGGCTWDKICAADRTCISWPDHVSLGPMTLTGLTGVADQVLVADSFAYYMAELPYPPAASIFDASSQISLSAPGDVLPAIDLTVKGVDALEVDETTYRNVILASNDAAFHWTAGQATDRIRLTIPAVNQCHGCPPLGEIVCDAEDTGTIVVPGALLAALPQVIAGSCVGIDCPQATLERYHSKVANLPQGDVELRVASVLGFGIEHAEQPPPEAGFLISVIESTYGDLTTNAWVSVANPPASEMQQIVRAEVSGCRFLEPNTTGVCETFCIWPGYCGSDNTCHEGTPQRFAGDIALTGLKAQCSLPVETYDGGYPFYLGVCEPAEPSDLFDEGTSITAIAAGGDDLPAFTLETPGVAPVVTNLQCDGFALEAGKYLQVTWEPGHQTGDRIRFFLRSANHGNQFGHIECDGPDDGILVVESSLIDMHLAAFNPAPSWGLVRVHTTGVEVDGMRVALEASSQQGCMY